MSLNWRKIDYFPRLMKKGPHANSALEMMVDDLHKDKNHTIGAFLTHFGSEDFMWALVRMLASENCRVAGNSAYIFGTLAEHGHGQSRVMSLINGEHPHNILADLTTMLEYDDTESVMNAAGTLGTLAESDAGREWMLSEACVNVTIGRVTELLTSMNMWTASNAALVLARLSIAEEGSQRLLNHHRSQLIITKLIDSLGMDEAGRGMNAAFAIGRLCDLDDGRKRLLHHKDSNKMIGSLCNMLSSKDSGCGKNACYALSCLAGSDEGHERLLNHRHSELMLIRLGDQLSNEDSETGWFAAMTMRTLASKRKGCLRLRDHPGVIPPLKEIHLKHHPHQELKEEVDLTLALLKRLEKPDPPRLEVKGAQEILVEWDPPNLRSGLEAKYRLFSGERKIYEGKDSSYQVTRLRPNMPYGFKIQVFTEGDDSPFSEFATATTEESAPDAPEAVRAIQVTTSQVKLGWSPPEFDNGALKCYYVYTGKHQVESTSELSCIVSGLAPGTSYDFAVCAYNHKGKGPKARLTVTTTDLGKHAPAKPSLTVRGRTQIHVTWAYPEFPLGRFHRFDLAQNGKVIYSGTDLNCTASRLSENTEYTFTVIAVTSEGKCESEPAKKKTPKAEYKVQSTAPIFFSHPNKTTDQDTQEKAKDKPTGSKQTRSKRSVSSPMKHGKSIRSSSPNSSETLGLNSRPLSAVSSMSSASKSKHRRKSIGTSGDAKKSKKLGVVSALKEHSRKMSISTASSDSDEDRWPGAVTEDFHGNKTLEENQDGGHLHSKDYVATLVNKTRAGSTLSTSASSHGDMYSDISGKRRTKSDSGVGTSLNKSDDEESVAYPISVKIKTSSSAPVKGQRDVKGQQGTKDYIDGDISVDSSSGVDDINFESRLFAQTVSSSQRLSENMYIPVTDSKHGVPVASVKEGAVENLYPHQSGSRNPKKQMALAKYNSKAPELVREANKLDRLLSSLNQDTPQGSKTTKQHVADVLEDTIAQQLHRSLAIYDDPDFELSGFNPSHRVDSPSPRGSKKTDSRLEPMTVYHPEFGQFTLGTNGQITHEDERPRTTIGGKKHYSSSEFNNRGDHKGQRTKHGLTRYGHSKVKSPKRHESLNQHGRLPLETDAGGDSGKLSMSSTPSWLTQAKSELVDNVIPFRSMLADTPSFHQRANAFISSHRPTLKKNLARIAMYPPQPIASANQATGSSTFEPDFPDLPNGKSNSNKYHFIPTQFRTQPVNLPGTTLVRGNVHDKGAYIRKLEVMSHMPPNQRKQAMCTDCTNDDDPDAVHVSLHYTHRHESPRSSSRHQGQVT